MDLTTEEFALLFAAAVPIVTLLGMNLYVSVRGEHGTLLLSGPSGWLAHAAGTIQRSLDKGYWTNARMERTRGSMAFVAVAMAVAGLFMTDVTLSPATAAHPAAELTTVPVAALPVVPPMAEMPVLPPMAEMPVVPIAKLTVVARRASRGS